MWEPVKNIEQQAALDRAANLLLQAEEGVLAWDRAMMLADKWMHLAEQARKTEAQSREDVLDLKRRYSGSI